MCETKLWAAKDDDGATNLYRSSQKPRKSAGGVYELSSCLVDHDHEVSIIACQGVGSGECREIKTLDILKSTVEYVPDPPTLKEAWNEYRTLNRQSLSCCGTARDLFDALQREFPDE